MNSLEAFDGLAANYQRFRPAYPPEIMNPLRSFVESGSGDPAGHRLLIDLGSGTGISTRLLRGAFGATPRVIGLDPSNDMLQIARSSTPPEASVTYIRARAGALPFGDATVDLLLAAQAIQWFQRHGFYEEALRTLKLGGVLAILENNRAWRSSPFLDRYEQFLETHNASYTRHYRDHNYAGELGSVLGFFVPPPVTVDWIRCMDVDTFLGMALSSTKFQAIVRSEGEGETLARVKEIATASVDPRGILRIPYCCRLVLARRIR